MPSKTRQDKSNEQPLAFELFSGCGGMTLGLRWAGFRVVGAIENDPLAVKTYQANHKDVFVWPKDIRKVPPSEIVERLKLPPGRLDLLAGCPPCQGFSQMRTLNGAKKVSDRRNGLVFQFLRFVEVLQPKAVMMENTPGLAVDWRIKRLLRELKKLGYDGECRVVNAASYGVPQRRRRMIMLASRSGKIPFPMADVSCKTVRDVIAGLPNAGESGDPLHDFPERHSAKVIDLIKRIPKNGGSRAALGADSQLECHKRCDGFKDIYGRMAWDKPAPTITSGCTNPSKGRFLHPEENRAITLREAALLQGFTNDYVFALDNGKSGAALMIGNALPPEFIRRHAVAVAQYLGKC